MRSAEREFFPLRRLPQAGDDRQLLLEPGEALAQVRERDGIGLVLVRIPAGPQPELHPAAAHLIHLRDADRQRTRVPESGRRHQRAEPDPGRLAGQPGQRHPGIGRAGQPADWAHLEVVIGAEEGIEAKLLGRARDRQ